MASGYLLYEELCNCERLFLADLKKFALATGSGDAAELIAATKAVECALEITRELKQKLSETA